MNNVDHRRPSSSCERLQSFGFESTDPHRVVTRGCGPSNTHCAAARRVERDNCDHNRRRRAEEPQRRCRGSPRSDLNRRPDAYKMHAGRRGVFPWHLRHAHQGFCGRVTAGDRSELLPPSTGLEEPAEVRDVRGRVHDTVEGWEPPAGPVWGRSPDRTASTYPPCSSGPSWSATRITAPAMWCSAPGFRPRSSTSIWPGRPPGSPIASTPCTGGCCQGPRGSLCRRPGVVPGGGRVFSRPAAGCGSSPTPTGCPRFSGARSSALRSSGPATAW